MAQASRALGTNSTGLSNPESAPPDGVKSIETAVSPDPDRKTLKPLGYVQESNGAVEAIVADGDGVKVVHVGDAYQGKYTIAQIDSEGVKVVGAAVPIPRSEERQAMATISDSTPSKSVGYAERRDGTRIDVVAENGVISLTQVGRNQTAIAASQVLPRAAYASQNPDSPAPTIAMKDKIPIKEIHKDGAIATTASDPRPSARSVGQPVIPSGAIGFVEKSDGKVEAIVDAGDGVNLTSVPKEQVAAMVASVAFLDTDPAGRSGLFEPGTKQADRLASSGPERVPPAGLSPGTGRSPLYGPDDPASLMQFQAEAAPKEPGPLRQPEKPVPKPEEAIADDKVIPEKPPPDEAAIAASFGEQTYTGESAKRDDAILESLGLANLQNSRASPKTASFEPAAPATGPPETEADVPSSFGFQDWPYGRSSAFRADLGQRVGMAGSNTRQPIVLKPIGYVVWQDGRTFAVIDDGAGGVRLVAAGEILDGRFRVVKVRPDEVELEELSIKQISLAAPPLRGLEDKPHAHPEKAHAATGPSDPRDSLASQPDSVIAGSRSFDSRAAAHVDRQHERFTGPKREIFTRSPGTMENPQSKCAGRKLPPPAPKLTSVLQVSGSAPRTQPLVSKPLTGCY